MNLEIFTTLSIAFLMPSLLSAGQTTSRPEQMNSLKHATLAPNIVVSMDLTGAPTGNGLPTEADQSMLCIPKENGEYILHSLSGSSRNMDFMLRFTGIRIDPANPIAPLITFRIEKLVYFSKREEFPPAKADDIQLSVPYATPRTIPIEIEKNEFMLEVRIERNPTDVYEAIMATLIKNEHDAPESE